MANASDQRPATADEQHRPAVSRVRCIAWFSNMADGKGCKCAAHSESECGCDADWTPQEVYDLRAENERLKEAIRRIAEQDATLSVCGGAVTVTMDARLTDEERFVLREVRDIYADEDDVKCNEIAAVIDGLLGRTK